MRRAFASLRRWEKYIRAPGPVQAGVCAVFALAGTVVLSEDLPLRLPAPPVAARPSARLLGLRARAIARPYGPNWRQTADAGVSERQYAIAADAYRREAAVYLRNGDVQGARAELTKAGRYQVAIAAFVRSPIVSAGRGRARLEPAFGCYLGAYIDRDDRLPGAYVDENSQSHKRTGPFEEITGRPHATYFMYMSYGRPFPWRWANALKREGQIPHIAWEPASLYLVDDEAYLRQFSGECARFNYPIFLRFAAEMNGKWTPYNGRPDAYRRAFRKVADAIHRAAPKAAMIWCPNAIPVDTIAAYYPGDDAVDWVGVNFYSVLFYDNDRRRPAMEDPTDLLRPIYDRYAARKPIAVGEWAATHLAACEGVARPAFAAEKIARFYAALPRVFPRVKMVNWYDANNLREALTGRRLNNYQITDDRIVLEAYRAAVNDPWFLGRYGESADVAEHRLGNGAGLSGTVRLSAWTKAPVRTRSYWAVDGRIRHATARPGAAAWTWNTAAEKPGSHRVSLLLYDALGRFIAGGGWTVKVTR
ncbi:MAG TPA: glycosyl hydrolase [Armatimonadota bacterium]|jgi:hypothetical protein